MASPITGLPSDPKVAHKVATITGELTRKEIEQGTLGGIFGSRANAPVNLAGVVIVASLVFIAGLYLGAFDPATRAEGIKAFLGLLSTALAYVFGRASKDE